MKKTLKERLLSKMGPQLQAQNIVSKLSTACLSPQAWGDTGGSKGTPKKKKKLQLAISFDSSRNLGLRPMASFFDSLCFSFFLLLGVPLAPPFARGPTTFVVPVGRTEDDGVGEGRS